MGAGKGPTLQKKKFCQKMSKNCSVKICRGHQKFWVRLRHLTPTRTMAVGNAVTAYAVRPTMPQTAGVRAEHGRARRTAVLLVSASSLIVSVFLGGGGATLPSLVVSAWSGVAQETSARILCRGYMRF